MNWKMTLDTDDSIDQPMGMRFDPSLVSKHAFESGTQPEDISKEQEKLKWADTVIL